MPPDSEVRSSIQSTTLIPASAAASAGEIFPLPPEPGRLGFGRRIFGSGGAGSLGMI
jgi:hypothetical protein